MGLLHPLPIPAERWGSVSLDSMMALPETAASYDGIVVFVDRLTKMFHAFPVRSSNTGEGTAKLMMPQIFAYHGMPESIISDRDPWLTGAFWQDVWKAIGTRLCMSTTNDLQSDGQMERANCTKQMLHASVNDSRHNWDDMLPVIESVYND